LKQTNEACTLFYMQHITQRRAKLQDLPRIVELLLEDELGKLRESVSQELNKRYIDAFHRIDNDPNQYLMVVEETNEIIAACHLTTLPSLTFIGSSRLQIEAVRVAKKYRDKGVGQWMLNQAIEYAKNHGIDIIQLTTNKKRERAKHFYEKLGFEATHEGMKLYLRNR